MYEFPEDSQDQLSQAIRAVFDSWTGERAVQYRRINRIRDDCGTAVNVQQIVFGNKGETSATGVAFSRDEVTGAPEPSGDFLINAQGEDVVAGVRTPRDLHELGDVMPEVNERLMEILRTLEAHYKDMQDTGLTGTAIDTGGPVSATFDDSPPDASSSKGPGVMFGFVGGDNARTYAGMMPSARQAAVLNQYATYFGSPALNAQALFETSWCGEAWTRGCPMGIPSNGTLLAYGPWIRQPVGAIYWAGTETSSYWNGYMDGAVRSGERAAIEVLAEL